MALDIEVGLGLGPGDFVLDWDPVPLPKRGRSPSPILRVEVENFEIGPEVGALPVIANKGFAPGPRWDKTPTYPYRLALPRSP